MKRMYWIMLSILPLLVTAGSYHKVGVVETPRFPNPSVIEVYDDVILKLDGHAAPSMSDNPAVTVNVENGVMSLRATPGKAHRVSDRTFRWSMKDHFTGVTEIRMYGRSNVFAKHMKSPSILRNNSSGQAVIDGYIPLVLFEQKGSGNTVLSFINAVDADVIVNAGTANLSGIAKRLRYVASAHAMVDAKALRVDLLWAHTKDSSVSFLMPIQQSHVIAGGESQLVLDNKTPYFSTLSSYHGEIVYNNLFSLHP